VCFQHVLRQHRAREQGLEAAAVIRREVLGRQRQQVIQLQRALVAEFQERRDP